MEIQNEEFRTTPVQLCNMKILKSAKTKKTVDGIERKVKSTDGIKEKYLQELRMILFENKEIFRDSVGHIDCMKLQK